MCVGGKLLSVNSEFNPLSLCRVAKRNKDDKEFIWSGDSWGPRTRPYERL
jgi:hypothetical protein